MKRKKIRTSISSEKKIGMYATELQQKDEKINPVDLQKTIHKGNQSEDSFENQIFECIERGIKMFEHDFYIVVLFKKERLLQNVVRQYFIPRRSCPTPEFDQVVYKYHYIPHDLEFIWVVPDQETCMNIGAFDMCLPGEQQSLIKFAQMFKNGDLDRKCAALNGEKVA